MDYETIILFIVMFVLMIILYLSLLWYVMTKTFHIVVEMDFDLDNVKYYAPTISKDVRGIEKLTVSVTGTVRDGTVMKNDKLRDLVNEHVLIDLNNCIVTNTKDIYAIPGDYDTNSVKIFPLKSFATKEKIGEYVHYKLKSALKEYKVKVESIKLKDSKGETIRVYGRL